MASQAPDAGGESIVIRMYRGILGDCFLLTHARGSVTRRILIDCGVLQGVQGGAERMRTIVADIARETRTAADGRSVLDLVIVTHEHADHLSGFAHGKDFFFGPDLDMRQLWLAWTENPADAQAQALRARFARGRSAMRLAADLTTVTALAGDGRVEAVLALDRFNRIDDDAALAAAPEFAAAAPAPARTPRLTGALVLEKLKEKAGRTRYLEPGELVRLDERDEASLGAFVLGPPRDAARLAKDAPSKKNSEVYLTSYDEAMAVESAAKARLNAELLAGDSPDPSPFALRYQRDMTAAQAAADVDASPEKLYFDPDHERLKIDDDWLDAAEIFALKMDSDTNNGSLVLAFALGDGQVLLFPGDAQVGNWLSWGDRTYPAEPKPGQTPIAIDDILRRVSFYKVGHHASHNATLKAGGLEKMPTGLAAMIPVVADVAKQQGSGWNMPYPELYAALQAKTGGRILRGDGDAAAEAEAFAAGTTALRHDPGGLWVEIEITAGPALPGR